MKCPYCGSEDLKVIDKRDSGEEAVIRRRRECNKCEKRFTTYERVEMLDLTVVKKDGKKEAFDREKLKRGLQRAAEKRISQEQIDEIVDKVEAAIRKEDTTEITSQHIGELVMKNLKKIDKIAYIRFASVYREFTELEDIQDEIKQLLKEKK